ncbi:exodeoxyribonuclease III [soil metagenome]
MKLATWNVNSLTIRLPHVLDWLARHPVDALCLQETKITDDKFPVIDFQAIGYHASFIGQKTYNGVAILSRAKVTDVLMGIGDYVDDHRRLISATIDSAAGPVRVISAYVPNGQAVGTDKYRYKLEWYDALVAHLKPELERHPRLALLGDYNVAPEDRDIHDPAAWAGQVLASAPERERFQALIGLGLVDAYRLFEQPERSFSWWDYRQLGFQKNKGLRIDHVLVTPELAKACTACSIDRAERKKPQPSDHAPVIATFEF